MLAKIAPRFVIQGVIQNAYYANYMAVDLTKQIIGEGINTYEYDSPKFFFVFMVIVIGMQLFRIFVKIASSYWIYWSILERKILGELLKICRVQWDQSY